jgi:hypothetical protein
MPYLEVMFIHHQDCTVKPFDFVEGGGDWKLTKRSWEFTFFNHIGPQ